MRKMPSFRRPYDPEEILHFFVYNWDNTTAGNRLDDTIIILGRPGPTGKTWLCNKLKEYGFNAIEISEDIYKSVIYTDDDNHMYMNAETRCVTIILNRPFERRLHERYSVQG